MPYSAARSPRRPGRRRCVFVVQFVLFLGSGLLVPAHTPAVVAPTLSILRASGGHAVRARDELQNGSMWARPGLSEQLARAAFRVVMQEPSLDRTLALDTPPVGAAVPDLRDRFHSAARSAGEEADLDANSQATSGSLGAPRIARLLTPLGNEAGGGEVYRAGAGTVAPEAPFHISLSHDLKLNWALRSQPASNARTELGVRVGLQYKF